MVTIIFLTRKSLRRRNEREWPPRQDSKNARQGGACSAPSRVCQLRFPTTIRSKVGVRQTPLTFRSRLLWASLRQRSCIGSPIFNFLWPSVRKAVIKSTPWHFRVNPLCASRRLESLISPPSMRLRGWRRSKVINHTSMRIPFGSPMFSPSVATSAVVIITHCTAAVEVATFGHREQFVVVVSHDKCLCGGVVDVEHSSTVSRNTSSSTMKLWIVYVSTSLFNFTATWWQVDHLLHWQVTEWLQLDWHVLQATSSQYPVLACIEPLQFTLTNLWQLEKDTEYIEKLFSLASHCKMRLLIRSNSNAT